MDASITPLSKIGALREALLDLLHEHERDGALPTSARFLYYELVQRGRLSKEKTGARRPDQDLHDALTDLREAGRVPWDWIEDETRTFESYIGSRTVRDDLLLYLPAARIDPWRGPPLVLTESRSVAGILRDTVRQYACQIAATNGQCGGFLRTGIAPRLRPADRVLYIGDYDLSGNQIEANTRRVLEQMVGVLRWERLALTAEQIAAYGLEPITKRDRRYADGGTHQAVETEALRQTVIVDILRQRLDELLPEPMEHVHEREAQERADLELLLRGRAS